MSAVDDLCRSYLDLRWHIDPADGSAAGAVAHDARLGHFDGESVREHLAALRALAGAAEELDTADLAEEIDRTALLDDMRVLAFRFEYERPHERNPGFWLNHLFHGIYTLLAREGEAAARAPAVLERLRATPAFLDAARATIRQPSNVLVDAALGTLGGGGALIAQATATFGAAAPPLAEEITASARAALEALAAFGRALGTDIRPSDDLHAFAVGEEQFERRLHHEHALRGGAPEMWRYGMHLQDEVEAEIVKAAAVIDPTRSWRDVVERVRELSAPTGDLLPLYEREIERARAFVEERGLMRRPDVPLHVMPTPSFMAPLVPFAAYDPPPVETGGPGRFYVTVPPDDAEPEQRRRILRQHSAYEVPSTVVHEAYPGHHLQLSAARALESEVRRHLWTPVAVEGWALYAETLMYEEGFHADPEARLFHLVNLLWRATRIVLDVGLHTRGMSPAEAVEMLVDRLPIERRSAEAEVRRYCAMPTYQLAYAVGRREILALRRSWRAAAGPSAPLAGFHEQLLSYGGLPTSLARWGMGLDAE